MERVYYNNYTVITVIDVGDIETLQIFSGLNVFFFAISNNHNSRTKYNKQTL